MHAKNEMLTPNETVRSTPNLTRAVFESVVPTNETAYLNDNTVVGREKRKNDDM
jgi:hypothetical protein